MNNIKTMIALLSLAIIGGVGVASSISLTNTQMNNDYIDEVKAVDKAVVAPQLKIQLVRTANATYSQVKNARVHLFNIKTYFDDYNSLNISAHQYETDTTRRIFIKDGNNWGTDIKLYGWIDNANKDKTTGEWPGINMIQYKDSGYYYADISKNTDFVIFSDNGTNQTKDLDLRLTNDLNVTYSNKDNNWISNDTYLFDGDSKYYYEQVGSVYQHNGKPAKVANIIDNDGESIKFEDLIFSGAKEIALPIFIKSFDFEIVGDLAKNDGNYLVQLQKPFHAEGDGKKSWDYQVAFATNDKPVISDNNAKIDKIAGYINKIEGTGNSLFPKDLNYYRYLDKYFKTIKHTSYNDDNYSICNSLKDRANQDNIKLLNNYYHNIEEPKVFEARNKLDLIIDKYENNQPISIKKTADYISSFISVNYPSINNVFGVSVDNKETIYTLLIIGGCLLTFGSFIIFALNHKLKIN